MRKRILLAFGGLGVILALAAIVAAPASAAGENTNLQVLSKNLSKKELRTIMKTISKAVDRSCDECHDDLKDFAKDNPLKKKAREMFRLTNSINARLKKDGFKKRVTCATCHAGQNVP